MAAERVLIVEDDLITARHVQDCLQALGYSVTAVAVSGSEAIDKAAETRPDLVLMDIRLEGPMDGVEAAGQIGSQFDIPVVYLTAYADEDVLHGAELTEPYGYILKPFEERDLRVTISMALYNHKMKQELTKSEERYRSLFENMTEGFAYCRMLFEDGQPVDFIYLDVNDAFERQTGLKDVVGKRVSEVIPDIKEATPELFEIYGRVALTGKPERFEIYLEPLDMWLSISVYSPEKEYFVAVFDVITERVQAESQRDASLETLRESEERFRTAVESLLDGFGVFSTIRDDAGRIVDFRYEYINEAGCRLNQRTREEQLGRTLLELLPAHKDTGLIDEYAQVVETGQPLVKESVLYEDVYGGGERISRCFDLQAVKMGDAFFVHWRDVTQRKQVESQRDAALEELQRYAGRLRQLTRQAVSAQEGERHRVSRELHDEAGQALTALKISLELLQSDLPPEAESLRQRLGGAVALTEETMEQMRLLAQDLRPPALDTVGLNPTLEGLCRDFAQRTQLSVDYDGVQLPPLPEAADICLYRVLQEALTNVVRHANAGHVRVALGCDAEGVSLLVEDDGQGMDEGATVPAGIGLLGMQERLEMLDGQLEIESSPGGGTRLRASIPLHRTQAEGRKGDDSRSLG